ncbi:D-amino-acid transaminase [Halanaerobacter jeridensis]|uniref:D-alanine aminotransferase n=1 Tax=Halanaerobacter jeridensis TaxID=706427 RepID=A0A938XRN6_9FIRM|nr:D-amino-acid transaminase [Halanaerobacter jeridensis]MBM7555559.1 D-alanine transaminase [Halanaerobacter jeridensis]
MSNIAYVNGEFVALEEATVSIEDRGFQFGDSIYEIIKLYNGKLFKLEDHIQRLFNSAHQIRLDLDYSKEELKELTQQVLEKNKNSERKEAGGLYIQITRGAAPRSHSFSSDLEPTVIMYLLPAKKIESEIREEGVTAITMPEQRWQHCNIKTNNLLPNILTSHRAKKEGADEGIFVTEEGMVTEGTSSNVFIVNNDKILTHPADGEILPGITRELVLELAADKFNVQEKKFSLKELYQADEVFITSTPKEVLGVIEVDDKQIAQGEVGPITKEIHKLYQNYIEEFKTRA